jgi:hypothetical protein
MLFDLLCLVLSLILRLQKIRSVGKSGMRIGATLRYVEVRLLGARKIPGSVGARTWLQLMCCTLFLELGVLISGWGVEMGWSGKCE